MKDKANKRKILLVEDDPNFGAVLRDYLSMNDFDVVHAENGMEGLDRFKKGEYHLCILDVMMPFKDGYTLAKEIREINKSIPIVFLTAKPLKEDVLQGYQVGADDYLIKPFDSEILLHKLRALLNRKSSKSEKENTETQFTIGSFSFDSKLRYLTRGNEDPIKLSPKENALLRLLVLHLNDLMPRELALKKIWNEDNYFTSRSMDVYIAKLRKYLRADDNLKIANLHGEGFRLIIKSESSY